jgi:hypothetical protein
MATTPFFFSGNNAKITVNGVTLAFATNIQYSVNVKHAAPRVLGMYEAHTLEPLMYEVTGSFTVIRYVKGLKKYLEDEGITAPPDVSNLGNGIGSWTKSDKKVKNVLTGEGNAASSFDPSKLHNSMMFDIELFQIAEKIEQGMFAKLRDCRITGSDFKIEKRGIANQTFRFQACYADEDSFNAIFSGQGQNLL